MSAGSFLLSLTLLFLSGPLFRVPAVRDAMVKAIEAQPISGEEKGQRLSKLLYAGMSWDEVDAVLKGEEPTRIGLNPNLTGSHQIYFRYRLELDVYDGRGLVRWKTLKPE